MSTINDAIITNENRILVNSINYLGDLLNYLDHKLYAKFVEENFAENVAILEVVYINLLEKLKSVNFNK